VQGLSISSGVKLRQTAPSIARMDHLIGPMVPSVRIQAGMTKRGIIAPPNIARKIMLARVCGAMTPLFVMPAWMRTLGTISPIKWSILAIEGAVWRNFTPLEMLKPCTILIAIGIATFGVGAKNVHLGTGGTVLAKGKKPATPEQGE